MTKLNFIQHQPWAQFEANLLTSTFLWPVEAPMPIHWCRKAVKVQCKISDFSIFLPILFLKSLNHHFFQHSNDIPLKIFHKKFVFELSLYCL